MIRNILLGLSCLGAMTWTTGCKVHVDKDANGHEKTVQVDTPFGGVHVNTDQVSAADLGLPVYPGAEIVNDDHGNKSADVHMGFGEWQLRVRAVSYSSSDPQDKLVAFYKKSLGRYGDVITCQGNAPVGTPTTTSEGLNCNDDSHHHQFQFNGKPNGIDMSSGLQLKAGSKRHQHIVGLETPKDGRTKFTLVALDLPAAVDGDSKSD